jgi:F0F1-type ATP synthase assembly protein I
MEISIQFIALCILGAVIGYFCYLNRSDKDTPKSPQQPEQLS